MTAVPRSQWARLSAAVGLDVDELADVQRTAEGLVFVTTAGERIERLGESGGNDRPFIEAMKNS